MKKLLFASLSALTLLSTIAPAHAADLECFAIAGQDEDLPLFPIVFELDYDVDQPGREAYSSSLGRVGQPGKTTKSSDPYAPTYIPQGWINAIETVQTSSGTVQQISFHTFEQNGEGGGDSVIECPELDLIHGPAYRNTECEVTGALATRREGAWLGIGGKEVDRPRTILCRSRHHENTNVTRRDQWVSSRGE
jgi:hypothetical protein